MALIESISGIRGTIGGNSGTGLTPTDIVRFTAAYASLIIEQNVAHKIVIGRDARLSGDMVNNLVRGTLMGMGLNVIDLGLSTTPTVEMMVPACGAGGGIIITASHNPKQWNALKLLNAEGEFISSAWGEQIKKRAQENNFDFADVNKLGTVSFIDNAIEQHIDKILALPYVDVEAIKLRNFTIALDAVNSSGGIAVPLLLKALGVTNLHMVNCEPTGNFAHNPEPLPDHLNDLAQTVKLHKADVGIAVDPDVDRLAMVCEDGSMF
jgi:phosphomannomutase